MKPWHLHDLRRAVATGMADLGVEPHHIEACLNHYSGHRRGVAGVYNRSNYERAVAAALARWGEVRKLTGKKWVKAAFDRKPDELLAMTITAAGGVLSDESKTAPDCAKPLSLGHCINLLRELGRWPKKPRRSS